MMELPVANPTATNAVVHRKSLRLGAFAFIGLLPHEARSGTGTDVAIIARVVRMLCLPPNNLKANCGFRRRAQGSSSYICMWLLATGQPDHWHRRLLRARRVRPCHRAAEQRHEVAAVH